MRRRTTVASLTCALLAVALGLAACAEPGRPDAEAPIVIAEIVDKTGPAKDFNDAANPGYDMAVEDINKAGGIGGRRLEVVQLDAASQPNRAPLVLRDATRSGAVAVLGPYSSNAAFAAAPLAEQLTVPIVLPTSSAAWKGEFNGFTFRLTPTLEKVVPEFVEHVLTALQVTRVGAVVDQANEASVTRCGSWPRHCLPAWRWSRRRRRSRRATRTSPPRCRTCSPPTRTSCGSAPRRPRPACS